MAYSQADKDKVRKSYISEHLPLDKCAVLHSISYPTVQRWKKEAMAKGDDWDKVKSAQMLAGGKIENVARKLLTELILILKPRWTMSKITNWTQKQRSDYWQALPTVITNPYPLTVS